MSEDEIVNKMLDAFKSKFGEAKEIYITLQNLKKYGATFELPNIDQMLSGGDSTSSGANVKIRSDEFYGKPQPKATEEYLRKVGHAMTLGDIYNALAEGGINFGNDGKKNLNIQLTRATRKFAKIGSGQGVRFGLLEWYPKRKKTKSEELNELTSEANGETDEVSSMEEITKDEGGT